MDSASRWLPASSSPSAARGSEEGDELAGSHREAESIKRGHARVTTREVLESNLDPRARCGLDASGHFVPPEKSRPNVCTSRSRVRRRPPRCPPTNDSATSRTNANSRDATAASIEVPALVRATETISTCRFGYRRLLAIVYSPSTRATDSRPSFSKAEKLFG